jgi:hypothetical protein
MPIITRSLNSRNSKVPVVHNESGHGWLMLVKLSQAHHVFSLTLFISASFDTDPSVEPQFFRVARSVFNQDILQGTWKFLSQCGDPTRRFFGYALGVHFVSTIRRLEL